MVKKIYGTGLRQNNKEIYGKVTYIERNRYRQNVQEKETNIEKRQIQ